MIKLKEILNEDASKKVSSVKEKIKNITIKVDNLNLSNPASEFLVRIAAVESCYGLNKNAGNNIWQIDPPGFADTQNLSSHPGLQDKFDILKKQGIDWMSKTYDDIISDTYLNCITARLYLGNKPGKIPSDLISQASYWKTHYNTSSGAGTVEEFINKNSGDGISGCLDYAK
jgi:hypothetical protein